VRGDRALIKARGPRDISAPARRVVFAGVMLLAGIAACDNPSSGFEAESGREAEEVVLLGLEYALQAFPEIARNVAFIEKVARPDAGSVPLDRTVAYFDSAHSARVMEWVRARSIPICRVSDHAVCPELTASDGTSSRLATHASTRAVRCFT
jgi:hypothetical protein